MKSTNPPKRRTISSLKGCKVSNIRVTLTQNRSPSDDSAARASTNGQQADTAATTSKRLTDKNCSDKDCIICAQSVPGPERKDIFAFGKCDHHICYVCSARLRVICDQSDCPICREKLDYVIFSRNRSKTHDKFSLNDCIYNEKYKIYFETRAIEDAFKDLLKYVCLECLKVRKSKQTKHATFTTEIKANSEEDKSSRINQSADSLAKRVDNSHELTSATSSTPSRCISPANEKCASKCLNKNEEIMSDGTIGDKTLGDSTAVTSGSPIQALLAPNSEDFTQKNTFQNVKSLKNHLSRAHKLLLCDQCLEHNQLFPFEYSYYDNYALKAHVKRGEPNSSHRGHPDCPFCGGVFFNKYELLRHMSREHYNCHLCDDQDQNQLIYFSDYPSLRKHFETQHYLCQKGDCINEQFTSAFRSLIEYNMHMVNAHGDGSTSQGESRQRRTFTLDSAPLRPRITSPTRDRRHDLPPNSAIISLGHVAGANNPRQPRSESVQAQITQQRIPSRSEFPALGQGASTSGPTVSQNIPSSGFRIYQGISPLASENFPSLPNSSNSLPQNKPKVKFSETKQKSQSASTSSGSATLSQRLNAGPSTEAKNVPSTSSRGINSFVQTLGGGVLRPEELDETDFPPLPYQPKSKSSKKSKAQKAATKKQQNNSSGSSRATMTLDQLISSSLTLSSSTSSSSKGNKLKGATKSGKQKPIRILL